MNTAKEASSDGFTCWLSKQADRDDPVGDLARDVAVDPNWPAGAPLPDLIDSIGPFMEDTLKTAYAEYEHQNRK